MGGFKYSHWLAWIFAALSLTALLSVARLTSLYNQRIGGPGFISQVEFERALRLPPIMGKARIKDITVHPGRGAADIVVFELLDRDTLRYESRRFAAPRAFRPLASPHSPAGTVQEFIKHNAKVRISFAWWDRPAVIILICAAGSAMLIGLVLRFRFRKEPKAEPSAESAPRISLGDPSLLSHIEDGDESAQTDSEHCGEAPTPPAVALAKSDSQTPLKHLSTQPSNGVVEDVLTDAKVYAGQYYPVEKKAPHAFTLVELLVVMGIIMLLIALLTPTLVVARRQAEQVRCASNLHQIGIALQAYANANRGQLPAWSGWHTWPAGLSDDSLGPAWTIELIPYLGSPSSSVFNCPSFPSAQKCRNYFLAAKWSGMNGRRSMKFTDVKMVSRFVLSGDKTQRQLYPPPFGSSEHQSDDADPDDFGDGIPVLAWPWDPGGFYMHHSGNNILFDDIHVQLFNRYDPAAMTFNPQEMQDWRDVTAAQQVQGVQPPQ